MKNLHHTFETLHWAHDLPRTNVPLRVAVRRLRWFRAAFVAYVKDVGEDLGCEFEIDTAKLGAAFVRWLRAVQYQRPAEKGDRREFFDFAASLMMREFVVDLPLRAVGPVTNPEATSAAAWVEGYICTMFCLSVHSAVIRQEFGEDPEISPKILEDGFWWTYRENSFEDRRLTPGFVQVLLGHTPDWTMPDFYRSKARLDH